MENKSSIIHDTIILVIITLVAGALLALIYEITKGPIDQVNAQKKSDAYKEVFKDGEIDMEDTSINDEFVGVDGEKLDKALAEAGYENGSVTECYPVKNGDEVIGYVCSAVGHKGYAGDVSFSVGITKDNKINGISILSHGETPGLGARCTDPADTLQKSLTDRDIATAMGEDNPKLTVSKDNPASDDVKVDALSGATITSRCVTNGVNAALFLVKTIESAG